MHPLISIAFFGQAFLFYMIVGYWKNPQLKSNELNKCDHLGEKYRYMCMSKNKPMRKKLSEEEFEQFIKDFYISGK